MPDYVDNKLTIRCKDENLKEKIKRVIFMYNEKNEPIFTMTRLLPRPEGFDENPTYAEVGYDWSCAVWGTKWDAIYPKSSESGNSITISYRTAWSANWQWIYALCRFIELISYSPRKRELEEAISVIHFHVDDYEDYGTLMTWNSVDTSYNFEDNISITSQFGQ